MTNKVVIITGASRGIGYNTTLKFLESGWHVIGTSTSGIININSPNFSQYKLNLSEATSIDAFIDNIQAKKLQINVLINNAGILEDFMDTSVIIDKLRTTLEVNLIGTIDLTEKLIPLITSPGHILNLSSSMGSLVENVIGPYSPAYKISKASINMYTKILAARLEKQDIIVSSVDPGWVKTDMGGDDAPDDPVNAASEIFNLATSKVASGYFWTHGKKRTW